MKQQDSKQQSVHRHSPSQTTHRAQLWYTSCCGKPSTPDPNWYGFEINLHKAEVMRTNCQWELGKFSLQLCSRVQRVLCTWWCGACARGFSISEDAQQVSRVPTGPGLVERLRNPCDNSTVQSGIIGPPRPLSQDRVVQSPFRADLDWK